MYQKNERKKQKMAEKKEQEEWNLKNTYREVEQEVIRIQEECVALQEKKKKCWKKTGILCGVLLLLGIAINVGTGIYFQNRTRGLERELEQEYSTKREDILERLGEEQP